MRTAPAHPLQGVDNALRLLSLLLDGAELRVSEAAEELQVARSTAHRLLAMLLHHGFAEQDSRRVYRLGPALHTSGGASRFPPHLLTTAHPKLRELSRHTGETTHLMVLEGTGVRFVDGVESPQIVKVSSRVGMLLPAHRTSGGKALLAELTAEEVRAMYRAADPGAHRRLGRQLTSVRRIGYAINQEESEQGVMAVGTVVRDGTGRAVAALAIAAPSSRAPRSRMHELGPLARAASEQISAAL